MSLIKVTEKKMAAVVEHFREELKGVRTGRANPAMLENLDVEVYSTKMRLRDVAGITAPEPRSLLVTPFDPSNASTIAKWIDKANLGFKCAVDGPMIRVQIPEMTQDTREKMAKQIDEMLEKTKVGIRHVRREAIDSAKEATSSEDEERKAENEIQKLTNSFCDRAAELAKEKVSEVMTV